MIHWNFELTIRILNSTACNRAMDFRSVFVIVQSIQETSARMKTKIAVQSRWRIISYLLHIELKFSIFSVGSWPFFIWKPNKKTRIKRAHFSHFNDILLFLNANIGFWPFNNFSVYLFYLHTNFIGKYTVIIYIYKYTTLYNTIVVVCFYFVFYWEIVDCSFIYFFICFVLFYECLNWFTQ